ncbi:DUF1501 domain-containing protein [Lignipirellula cremea]|uniref:DUF1501 domain-containing protein n=1 Tax=Lignipirellula cremea TaxID=2528010 RepID=A0A518DXN4_9BACT|nr:DUF1501 domain-containing protein [Lignipirellula cremea]QDU96592.1 hypothetical protein Pla8534_44130 [Lignipirellula cremea]
MNKMKTCYGPASRRSFLKMGVLGVSGLSLAEVMRMQAAAGTTSAAPDTSVIFVWLAGGPPHMETYDMKPDAPEDYRGQFRPISTNVPGIEVCEHLPLHAKCADKYTLIRSIAHTFNDHGGGSKRFMTGRIPATPTGTLNDSPSVISIVNKMREHVDAGVPNCVTMANGGRSNVDTYAQGAAYLGMKYNYFPIGDDPSSPNFAVRNMFLGKTAEERLGDRRQLLSSLDQLKSEVDSSGTMEAMDEFSRKAFGLLTSARMHEAFDLSREPQALRERYGMHAWGQRALMARRLVEAGCSFVTVAMENPYISGVKYPKNGFYNWDSHAVNCDLWTDARHRFPIYDKAITALIEDLHARSLTKKVLLVVTGEFGRSPKISVSQQADGTRYGREHWPQAMSVLVCGGGMRHGQVIGSTNDKGEHPHDRPLTPNDLWATVYKHLGIDQDATITDYTGRPQMLLPFGEPIRELI